MTMSHVDIDLYLTGEGAHRVSIPESAIQAAVQQCGHWERTEPLDVPRSALLVVDMQNAFVVAGNPTSVPGASRIIPNINQLARAIRTQGGLVVWLRMASLPGDWGTLYDSFLPGVRDSVRDLLIPGNVGHRLHDQMEVQDADVVLDKTRFSAFIGSSSELDSVLRERRIETLIVTGTLSNVCCESTARDGMMLNYRVIFVSDANAAPNDALHNATLTNMIRVFGTVGPTSSILRRLSSS
jgi:ureidoacrylate peracid hydrolase